MKKLFYLSTLCFCILFSFAQQPGELDHTFNSSDIGFGNGDGANSIVWSSVIQTDNKIIIVGNFTEYNGTVRNSIARLNVDGTLDTTFNPGIGANNAIYSIALQPDGKIVIGGLFTSYNGTNINHIARLNENGTLDTNFDMGSGTNLLVNQVVLQPDGKIIISGIFTTYNDTTINRIARLNANGTLDTTFDPGAGPDNYIETICFLPDGKILIGGWFSYYNGIYHNRLARLHANGSLDISFQMASNANNIYAAVIQPDGKIIVGGAFTLYQNIAINRIARLNANGALDTTFNPGIGANNTIRDVYLEQGGKIIIAGRFTKYNGTDINRIVRLNSNGTFDASFNPGTGANSGEILSISKQPDGKMIIAGTFNSFNTIARNRVTRIFSDGSHDLSFNSGIGANNAVWTTALQPDGKIIIGGGFGAYNNLGYNQIARLNIDGLPDLDFNTGNGTNGIVYTTSIQPDGKIIIGGAFSLYNDTSRNRIARLHSDGSLDLLFNPGTGANNKVCSVILQPDGKILIGGAFSLYNDTSRNRIARLHSDGSLDLLFNPGIGANDSICSIALQPDGKILIGGYFTSYNGIGRNRIARLHSDGSLDLLFNPDAGANDWVQTIMLQHDGKIIIGGGFSLYNSDVMNHIARLNAEGSIDTSFHPGSGANGIIRSTAIQLDGKIIIGGDFTLFNGSNRNRLARLNANGTLDDTFEIGTGANKEVYSISLSTDDKIIIGGNFTAYNGIGRNRVARIFGGGSNLELLETNIISPAIYCAGAVVDVGFTAINGTFNTGNTFTAQLSDASGSFALPVSIGTIASTNSGTINSIIPLSVSAGTGYRIRVVSNNPELISNDNGSDITVIVVDMPEVVGIKNCGPAMLELSVTQTENSALYRWFSDATDVTYFHEGTTYTSLFSSSTTLYISSYNDFIGCESERRPVDIIIHSEVSAQIDSVKDVTCFGGTDGFVFISVSNGTYPINYEWSNNTSQQNLYDAEVGNYEVTVTDANYCNAVLLASVIEPNQLFVTVSNDTFVFKGNVDLECVPLSVENIFGGVSPYTLEWSTGDITGSFSVCPNTSTVYGVTITDTNGCIGTDFVQVKVFETIDNFFCGSKGDKIKICISNPAGKSNTICVAADAATALLANNPNAIAGECNQPASSMRMASPDSNMNSSDASSKITIYPNPATSDVRIIYNSITPANNILVSNIQGKVVKNINLEEYLHAIDMFIDIHNFSDGYYTISVRNNGAVLKSMKLIKNGE